MRHRHLLWFGLLAAVLVTLTLGYATFFAAAQATVRIQYGDTVTGEIATTNEIDRWEFDGTQDDVIAIQINRTDGNLIPSITLNDPEGVMILSLDWPVDGPAQILFTATLRTSGPHVLAISGATRNTNTTGAYTLNLTLQEAGTQEEGILTYGRVVSGEITDTTFREFWTFRGTRGDVIDAIMSATSGDLDTYLSLISPQGDVLVSTDFGSTGTDAALFAVTLPTTGNYSLSARRAGGNFGESGTTQGTYNLALTLRQAGSEDVEPTPLMLTPGIGTRGRLNADAPTALYSVNARGVLALALDMTDPTQVGTLTVMTPSGALLNTFSGITPVRANVTLPEQGTYWIEVSAIGLREAIPLDFGINVEQLTTTQRAARPLIYDRPQRITASSTQPEAWYFHGQTGDLVEIALTPFNPELAESSMQIVAPDGTVVATRSIRTQTTQSLLLADSGAYEIILSPGALSDGYQIVVNKQGMAGLDFKQYTEPVEQGTLPTTNAVEGVLDVGGSDTWIIDVQEAQTWQFRLDQLGTDVSAGLIIEAPNGEWLDMITTDRLTNTATLRVHLPHAGRYRAVVFDPTHEASHTYTLQGAPGEGGEFALDTPVKGVLTTTKPSDRWSVLVPSDMLLNVDVTLLVGTSAPTLQIVGPDGLLVATNASGEQRDSLKLVGIPVEYGGQFDIVIKQPSTSERLVYLVETTVVAPFGHTANVTPFVDLPVEEVFATDISTDTASTWVNLADHITPRILPDAEFLAVAASMGFDTLNRGEIRTDQAYQAWQFSVNANQMVSFSVVALEDTSGPDLFVLNAGGTVLAETLQTGTSSAYMTHRFADGGTYTLVVKLDHGGRYTLAASVLTGIDETVPQVISGQTMSYGDVMEGEIIQPDDVQRYVFWGKAGDVISSQALRTQGNTNLNLTLFDTNNTTLQQAAMSTIPPLTEIVDYRLAGDGLYQLMVTHEGDDAGIAGRFALSLTLTESTANQRDGGVLIAGEPSIASLESNNAPHHWLFAGQSGEQVTIRLEPLTDGTPTPLTLQLADSAGNVFLQKETLIGQGGLAFDRVLLPRGGVYQAMVSGGRTPGVYRISLERDTRNTQDDERAIRYGETTGKVLTPENFLDVWTFAGTAGDVVTAHVRTVRGDLPTLSVQLRAQDGTVLETSLEDGAGSRLEQIVLPMDGHYSLIVGNVDGTFAGEAAYEVTLLLEDTAARSMGTVTTYGHAVEGYFYLDDSIDTWIFEGQQGDVISATVSSTAADLYPVIELIATDWRAASAAGQAAILASAQGAENSPTMLEFVLPATGAYALRLRDQALVGGPYTLELDTLTPTAAPPGAIRYGQSKSGQLGDIHVADSWQFEAVVGEAVTITAEPDSRSQLAPSISLLDATGQVLTSATAPSNGTARIAAYPLNRSGVYTIVVARHLGVTGYTEGRYTVSVESSVVDTRNYPTTTYGQIQRGGLGADNVRDVWALVGSAAGDVVRVYAEATSGDLDPTLRIVDVEGNVIATADDELGLNAEVYASLPTTGPFYIEVARYGAEQGASEGNYALVVEVAYLGETVTADYALAYGDRVVGSVDSETRSTIWEFTGEKGDTLRAKIQFPRDDSPLALNLRNPSGETLATGERDRGDAIIAGFTLPYSGIYTLEVRRPGDARAVHSPYSLELSLLSIAETPVFDHGGVITAEQAVTAIFTTVPASHSWVFAGYAQLPISLTMNRLDGVLPQQIALYTPDGSELFVEEIPPGIANAFATGTIYLPYDGLYTLVVMGNDVASGSSYRLTLREIASDALTVQQISPLADGFGAITNMKPYERWTFDVIEGDIITLRVSALSGDLDPTLMVWGPDRHPLAEGKRETTSSNQAVIKGLVAQATGTYEITVGRAGLTYGTYRVMIRHGSEAMSSQAASAVDMELNAQVANYTAGKSAAYYAFRGEAGDVVGVSVQLTESGTLPDLALETEAGTPIRTPVITTDNETYIPAFALPADGRYVIKLDSHATVGYELSAFTRKADTPENALVRSLGENRTFAEGVLDPARPTYWQFPGEVGDVLTFTIDTRGGGLRADATLYGPDGYITNAVEYPGPDMTLGPVRLPATGDYLLIVGPWLGEMGGSTGQYSLLAATAEAGVSGSAGGHIAVWDQRVVGGFIVGDTQDVWTFDGRADDMITIQAEQTFGEGSFNLTLAGPDNLELIASEPATSYLGSEIVGFTLPVDGVYTVTVNSRLAGESSVEYTLVVSLEPRIPDGTVALSMTPVNTLTLPMAVAQHGQITLEQPVQSWLIYPTYTGTYVIDVASLVVGANLDVFVLQTDSVPLTNSDQHTRISASLAAGVGYVVQVSGGPTMERGRYTLEVMPAITLTYGAPITVGASNVGRIDDTAQHNEWRVQGQVNTAWIIEVTPITGNLIPNVTIAGPTGDVFQQTISDIHDPLSVTFQVPADGSYAVEISGVGFTTGDYMINLREG